MKKIKNAAISPLSVCAGRTADKGQPFAAHYPADPVSGDETWQECPRLLDDNKASGK
jgi:hypothetical protein